ncbi:membrane protein [Desulfuromonas versatilis]|uniref:Membrane protein n=1 Tax=Desulfuromonas versatilis TaxID=2802975 RepID=A0ABM8HX60_9BACT|nr:zinc-ribbon domain-containing protein [Desulfuromonas versatilis]BCR05307.1 membrane protein [Desulfuromonas versatilis]
MRILACPHCGFSKQVPADRIPAGTKRVSCPKCKQLFNLDGGTPAAPRPAPPQPPPPAAAQPSAPAPKSPAATPNLAEQAVITCPHCGYRREVPREKIPPRPAKVLCRQCEKEFTIRGELFRDATRLAANPQHPTLTPAAASEDADGPAPTRLAGLGELFSRTWEVFKRRILTLIGINLLAMVLALAAYFLLGSGADLLRGMFGDNPVVMGLAALVMVGLSLLVVTAVCAAMTYAIVDEDLGVREALGYGIQNFRSFLWVFTLAGFILCGGYLAFILPGLLFTVWFVFAQFVLAHDDVRGMEALLKSRAYVRGHGWGVCGRLLLLGVLGTVVSLIPIVGLLASLLLGPFTLIYYHEIFRDLRAIKTNLSYPGSGREKAKWLLAGTAGYLVVPVFGLLLLGPAMWQGLNQLRGSGSFEAYQATATYRPQPAFVEQEARPLAEAEQQTGMGAAAAPAQSPTTLVVPRTGENPAEVMLYVYAINYRGSVRLNGEEIYPIEGERDMNYNYTGSATLQDGRNVFEVAYQALPDAWMTKLQLKVFRYDWTNAQETVFAEWTIEDPGSSRAFEVILGD